MPNRLSPLVCFDQSLHIHYGGPLKRTITALSIAAALLLAGCSTGSADNEAASTNTAAAASEAPAVPESAPAPASEAAPAPAPEAKAPEVPSEFKSALKSAETYASMMNMSKAGVYDQLVSEFGGKFAPEAAQYAIDTVEADWNANALESAKTFQESMAMSPEAIRDQLTSEFGSKFTPEEAEYAIANLP